MQARLFFPPFAALVLLAGMLTAAWGDAIPEAGVTCYPLPAEVTSTRYKVTINGKPAAVFAAAMNIHFVSFDAADPDPVTVTVTSPDADYWKKGAIVRPSSRGIVPTINGQSITFRVTAPAKLSIEQPGEPMKGSSAEVLYLFASVPDSVAPPMASSPVILIPPGMHRQDIDLKSGQTLYLAGGAVLMGSVNIWDAENVRIEGRGTIVHDGPQPSNKDTGWTVQRNWRPISINRSRNVSVSGITCVVRSRTWCIQNVRSSNLRFENINIISATNANVNGDGIDFMGGGHAVVNHCFLRCCDDAFAFYNDFVGDFAGVVPPAHSVTDIAISHSVFCNSKANTMRVGFLSNVPATSNISMTDCDIIHIARGGDQIAPYSLLHIFVPLSKDEVIHENYLFENIRLEDYNALIGVDAPTNILRNFRFHNITAAKSLVASVFHGKIDPGQGIIFEKIKIDGTDVHKAEDIPMTFVETDAAGVVFK